MRRRLAVTLYLVCLFCMLRAEARESDGARPEAALADYAAARAAVAAAAARGEWPGALAGAHTLVARCPDDPEAWALLIDAEIALGDLDAAERDAQVLLDMRPDEAASLYRAARLRALLGDDPGAIEALLAALARLAPTATDTRAAWLTELARLYDATGRPADARAASRAALAARPEARAARAARITANP